MTSNIIVFQPPELRETTTNKTEQEVLYDRLEKTASIPAYHFKTFMEMEIYNTNKDVVQSSIPSIIIKQILPYCTPIIKEIPEFTVKLKTVDVFKKNVETRVQSYYNISMQLGEPIQCLVESTVKSYPKTYIVPTNTMFSIIGIVIPQKIITAIDTSFPNFITSVDTNELLLSGMYGLLEFQSGRYTQSDIKEITPSGDKTKKIYFDSDDDAKKKIHAIIKNVRYIGTFYENNFAMVYQYIKQRPFIRDLDDYIKKFTTFYPLHKKDTKTTPQVRKLIENLIHIKTSGNDLADNFMFSIFDVFETYNKFNMLGMNHPHSKKMFQELDLQNTYNKTIVDYQKTKFKKKLEFAKKQAIALNKFKTTNMAVLTVAQLKIVDLEYNKLEQYYLSMRKFEQDFQLVNTLFWAINNDKQHMIKEKLDEIAKIVHIPKNLGDRSTTEMLQNKQKINIICPHIVAKATKMLEKFKSDLIKSGQIREYLISTFSLPVTEEGYFCRICGELIADADDDEISKYVAGKRVTFIVEFDQLKSQMWKEVAHIMTTYVKFKNSVNLKPLVSLITDTLRPEIGTIEAQLTKIKSNSKDSIKNLVSIYITIYTFAMVVHMIHNNYGNITFSVRPSKTGGAHKHISKRKKSSTKSPLISEPKKKRKKSSTKSPLIEKTPDILSDFSSDILGGKQAPKNQVILQNIINNALYLILKTKNILINSSVSMSSDSIKPILLKAYRWVASLKNTESTFGRDEADKIDEIKMLKTNPIYNYINYIHDMYSFYKNNGKKKSHSINATLGRTWDIIEKEFNDNKSLYETIVIPEIWNTSESAKYKYESFKNVVEYITLKLYNQYVVPMSMAIKDHTKKYKFLKKMEEKFHDDQKIDTLRPFNNIDIPINLTAALNNFSPEKIKIEKYYDNNGIKHKFDKFIFQQANAKGVLSGAKKEYSKKDVLAWINDQDMKKAKEFKYMFIIDEKCSICDVLLSQVKNVKVDSALLNRQNIETFFLYYENRCPKGELHDFVITGTKKENSCSKCGITKAIVDSNDKHYYDKYIKTYDKTQSEKLDAEKNDVRELSNNKIEKVTKKTFPPWKINNASILELSRVFNIKYNIIINLGLSYGIKYKLIELEQINPHVDASADYLKFRNITLHGYYLNIVRLYYLIKNHDIIQNIPLDLKLLLAKNKVRDLNKKLPDLDTAILEKYEYYKNTETQHNISNFLLHSISHTIIDVYQTMKKLQVNIANELAMYIIDGIIFAEKIVSEPDMRKLSVKSFNDGDMEHDVMDTEEIGDGEDIRDGYTSMTESVKDLDELGDSEPEDEFATGDLDIERDNMENFENHGDM